MFMSRFLAAIVISLGISVLGLSIYKAQMDAKDRDRVVQVRGLAEREVPADYVIWPVAFQEMGNDLSALYKILQEKSEVLQKFLLENGISKEEISISAPDIVDTQGEIYSERKFPYRYKATFVVTVASSKVDVARSIMGKQGELLNQGIAFVDNDYRYRKIFSFNGLNEIKPAMIEEATRNARAAADKFARDSESKLGKIKTASQGQFTIDDRDENTPYIKKIRVVTAVQYFLED